MAKRKAKPKTARFKVVGNHAVLPPPKHRAILPGRTGESDDLAWVEWAERAGHIRRTDNRSTVFPSDNKPDDGEKGGE